MKNKQVPTFLYHSSVGTAGGETNEENCVWPTTAPGQPDGNGMHDAGMAENIADAVYVRVLPGDASLGTVRYRVSVGRVA